MKIKIIYTSVTTEDWNKLGVEWSKQKKVQYSYRLPIQFRDGWEFKIPESEVMNIINWHKDYTEFDGKYGESFISITQYSNSTSLPNNFNVIYSQREIIEFFRQRGGMAYYKQQNDILYWCQENINNDFELSLNGKYELCINADEAAFELNDCHLIFEGFVHISFIDDASAMAYKLMWGDIEQ